jgi:hypothetical protein
MVMKRDAGHEYRKDIGDMKDMEDMKGINEGVA